jgi:hypothetical protein
MFKKAKENVGNDVIVEQTRPADESNFLFSQNGRGLTVKEFIEDAARMRDGK